MPQLPGFQEQTRLSPSAPVQIASTGDARMQGEQLSSIGKNVMQATSFLAEAQAESTKNQAISIAQTAQSRAVKESVDGRDIPALTQKYTEEGFNQLKQNTDPLVNFKLDKTYGHISSQNNLQAQETSVRKMQDYTLNLEKNNIDETSKKAQQFPDLAPQLVQDARDRYMGLANNPNSGMDHLSATKLFDLAQEKIAVGRIEGMLSKPDSHGQLARELGFAEDNLTINLKPEELSSFGLKADGEMKLPYVDTKGNKMDARVSEVYRGLKPEYIDRILDRLKAENEREQRVKLSTVTAYTNAFVAESLSGKEPQPQDVLRVKQMIAGAPKEVQAQYMEQITEAQRIAPVVQAFRTGTEAQGNEKLAAFLAKTNGEAKSSDQLVRVKAEQLQSKAFAAIKNIIDTRAKDPVNANITDNPKLAQLHAAAKSNSPEDFGKYAIAAIESQKLQGVATPRLLTNSDAVRIGQQLEADITADPRAMDNTLSNMESTYGEHFHQVISEIADKNTRLDKSLIIAAQMSDRESRLAVFSNMGSSGKAIDDRFKQKVLPGETIVWRQALNAHVDKFQTAIGGVGGSSSGVLTTASAFSKQIEAEAKKNYVMGMDMQDAMKAANDTIVAKNFKFVDTLGSKVIVPRSVSNLPGIEKFLYDNDPRKFSISANEADPQVMTKNALTKFGVGKVTQEMIAANPNVPVSELQSNYYNLISTRGAWVSNRDQTGVNLVIKYGDSNLIVKDNAGKPVQVRFNDMPKYLGGG